MPSSHLILCHPLLLLPPIPPSIRVFSNESTLRMRWPKYWSFSFSIIPSKEIPGLISFWMDWLDLLAVQGTLKSLLQHHSSKASILRCSVFFTVQFSHPYMTTGKTIALTRRTLVGKVMSLLLNMLSRLVTNFLPRSKPLLISWLQSLFAVILEPPKIKSDTVFTVSPSISHELPPCIFPGRSVTSNALPRARSEEDWRSQGWLQAWETGLCSSALMPSIINLLLQMLRLFMKSWNWAGERAHLLFFKRRGIPHQSILWSQATRASLLFLDTPDTSQRSSSQTSQASWFKWPNSPCVYIYQSTCHLYTIIYL